MTYIFQSFFICLAVCFVTITAVPVEEAIPEGIEGTGNEPVSPADDQSFLLKLKILKKLLFLG
ncbi:hypothetical protein KR222_009145 [Zaprionus bogoriensis]|nr:hypothetical protein KR222_009145 [Zaprionus bogoriensis]